MLNSHRSPRFQQDGGIWMPRWSSCPQQCTGQDQARQQTLVSLLPAPQIPPSGDPSCLCHPEAPWKALAQQRADSSISAAASLSPQRLADGQGGPAAQQELLPCRHPSRRQEILRTAWSPARAAGPWPSAGRCRSGFR